MQMFRNVLFGDQCLSPWSSAITSSVVQCSPDGGLDGENKFLLLVL